MLVVRQALLYGRGNGSFAALGVAAGVAVWVVAAVTGIAAVLALSATLYTVVKVLGGAYLVYVGLHAVLAARRGDAAEVPDASAGTSSGTGAGRAFRQGLLCNVLNPKAAVFFVARLPQFLPRDPGLADSALVSVVAPSVTAVWFLLVAQLVAALRRWLARPRVRRAVDTVSGTALMLVGVRVLASARVA